MNYSLSIIGGDCRNIKLAQLLANENNNIEIYGFEESEELKNYNNIKICNNLEEIIYNSHIIIAPIPLSKDKESLHMAYSKEKIKLEDFFIKCKNKTILSGNISKEIKEKLEKENINIIDLLDDESLTVYNTIATAEGTIKILIENTQNNLAGSRTLILGFGRVAKTLAKKLQGLDVNVTCAARKKHDLAWIETYGYNKVNINEIKENLYQYDIIINTVPNIILTEEKLQYVRKNSLLVDLASIPGGMDIEAIKKRNLKYIWALALPRENSTTCDC